MHARDIRYTGCLVPRPLEKSMATCSKKRVCMIHSSKLLELSEKNPRFAGRGKLVHTLIEAYGLLKTIRTIEPRSASPQELQTFHSLSFLSFLEAHTTGDEIGSNEDAMETYGLGYDCPLFAGVYEYVCAIGGSSLTAAEVIVKEEADTVLNWYGGWHHAKKDEASGFCYCNDIVLAILALLVKFQRVLYVDIDIHHGDGVEDAFYHTSRVMTVSFHKYSPGFFPGSGDLKSVGSGRGKFCCINVPLNDGLTDATFQHVLKKVLSNVRARFVPDVVVMQCGADTLWGDPVGSFSLTPEGVGECIRYVLSWELPTLLLGGGGYNYPNTARLWTYCTGLALENQLSNEIPEHENFVEYGPGYELQFPGGNRPNENKPKVIEEMLMTIAGNLSQCHVDVSSL